MAMKGRPFFATCAMRSAKASAEGCSCSHRSDYQRRLVDRGDVGKVRAAALVRQLQQVRHDGIVGQVGPYQQLTDLVDGKAQRASSGCFSSHISTPQRSGQAPKLLSFGHRPPLRLEDEGATALVHRRRARAAGPGGGNALLGPGHDVEAHVVEGRHRHRRRHPFGESPPLLAARWWPGARAGTPSGGTRPGRCGQRTVPVRGGTRP